MSARRKAQERMEKLRAVHGSNARPNQMTDDEWGALVLILLFFALIAIALLAS